MPYSDYSPFWKAHKQTPHTLRGFKRFKSGKLCDDTSLKYFLSLGIKNVYNFSFRRPLFQPIFYFPLSLDILALFFRFLARTFYVRLYRFSHRFCLILYQCVKSSLMVWKCSFTFLPDCIFVVGCLLNGIIIRR